MGSMEKEVEREIYLARYRVQQNETFPFLSPTLVLDHDNRMQGIGYVIRAIWRSLH
jgi:hypothetical protein